MVVNVDAKLLVEGLIKACSNKTSYETILLFIRTFCISMHVEVSAHMRRRIFLNTNVDRSDII